VLTSLLAIMPEARDGVNFSIIYTPLSYIFADDRRYAHTTPKKAEPQAPAADAKKKKAGRPKKLTPEQIAEKERAQAAQQRADAFVTAAGEPSEFHGMTATSAQAVGDDRRREEAAAARSGRKRGRPSNARLQEESRRMQLDDRLVVRSEKTLADPAIYVALTDEACRSVWEATAPIVLVQRARNQPRINAHSMPLVGPAVARTLTNADNTALPTLCNSLNALSTLIGGATLDWRPSSDRTHKFAARAAKLASRLVDLYALTMHPAGTDFDPTQFCIGHVLYPQAIYQYELRKHRRERDAAPVSDDNVNTMPGLKIPVERLAELDDEPLYKSMFSPLSVILNASMLPVAVARTTLPFFRAACAGDERLMAQLDVCDELDRERSSSFGRPIWYEAPPWYEEPIKRAHAIKVERARIRRKAYREARLAKELPMPDKPLSRSFVERRRMADESNWFTMAQQSVLEGTGSTPTCFCGAADAEECALMAQACVEGVEKHVCCLCALDITRPVPGDAPVELADRFMPNVCTYCRTRVSWAPLTGSKDHLMAIEHVELTQARADVTALDFIERILDYCDEKKADRTVADYARNLLDTLCFRLRRWRSSACLPPSAPYKLAGKRKTPKAQPLFFKTYRRHVLATSVNGGARIGRPLFQEWRNKSIVASSGSTAKVSRNLPTDFSNVLDATDALRDQHHIDALASSARREPGVAMALLLSTLESATFVRTDQLSRELIKLSSLQRSKGSTELANSYRRAVCDFVVPFGSIGELCSYAQLYEQAYSNDLMPLCAAAIAESTVPGGSGMNSLTSDWHRDATDVFENTIHNGNVPRPLSGTLPLLSELAFVNWYDPYGIDDNGLGEESSAAPSVSQT
jgi:hypothetical protein